MREDIVMPKWNAMSCYPERKKSYLPLKDDKSVLKNPHKGWYWHFVDNGLAGGNYRAGVEENDGLSDFPALNHLYLRLDWADIEKENGVFDWSFVDSTMEKWGKRGYRFSFRFVCFEGPGVMYASPSWLIDEGANGWRCQSGAWQPDYGDEVFLKYLERFLNEAGRKLNGNPLVEYVDIGTFGTWGEGHSGHAVVSDFPLSVRKTHALLHLRAFPDTPVLVNDDFINAAPDTEDEKRNELVEFCVTHGLGIRDDTILCDGYSADRTDGLLAPFLFDKFYGTGIVDIESDHYRDVKPDVFRGGFPLYETLHRAKATFCGFHHFPRPWLEENKYVAERLGNKLGYWYFIEEGEIPRLTSGLKGYLSLTFHNDGFSRAYYPFTLRLTLRKKEDDGTVYKIFEETGRNLKWEAESSCCECLFVDLKDVPKGTYRLCVGLYEGDTPIKLGIREKCLLKDGSYDIDDLTVE